MKKIKAKVKPDEREEDREFTVTKKVRVRRIEIPIENLRQVISDYLIESEQVTSTMMYNAIDTTVRIDPNDDANLIVEITRLVKDKD